MSETETWGTADLHTHTSLSDGMMGVEELLQYVQEKTTVDVLAVTDHDDITAGLLARKLAEQNKYRFEVIVGCEVTTRNGHLLGLFLEEPIKRLQSAEKTLKEIHRQGGIAIAPHPLSFLVFSLGGRTLRRVQRSGETDVYFDGIETANATIAARHRRDKVRALNRDELHLAEIGASDAHFLSAVGAGNTRFEGRTAADLRKAIAEKTTQAVATELELRNIGYRTLVKQQVQSLVLYPTRAARRSLGRMMGISSADPE